MSFPDCNGAKVFSIRFHIENHFSFYLTLSSLAPPSGISNIHSFIVLSGDVVNTSGSLDRHRSVVTDLW